MNTFDMMIKDNTQFTLTTTESERVNNLVKVYGAEFGESAKAVITSNHIESFSTIAKAKAVFVAINGYESKCGDKRKCTEARKAFETATEMSQSDITRYMSIYASVYCVLLNSDLFSDDTLNTAVEKLELYLSQFEYTKLFELAKLSEKDLLYIVSEYKSELPNLSKAKLIFALESYKMKVAPSIGRDKDFKNRLKWLATEKKLADYGKEPKPENKPENKPEEPTPTTASELADIELSFGTNSIGKLADTSTWTALFTQLEKCGIMDVFTVAARVYCENNNISDNADIAVSSDVE